MASAVGETKSDNDSDNHSYSATEVTTSEERLFREMASAEFQSEDDQLEEGMFSDELFSDEGLRNYGDQKTMQLSLIDEGTSAFLSHSLVDSDGENDEDLDSKTSDVIASDQCLNKSGPQVEPKSWEILISSNKKTKKKSALYICLTYCKYDSVHRVAKMFGFKEVMEIDDWNLFWTDGCVTLSRMMDMKKFQKINHFPGMSEICRKDLLARNMNRMLKAFPKDYNIFPRTWCLPADYADFQLHARRRKHRTYIVKPESSCQGRGIWLTKKIREVSPVERLICQFYISKPFLIDQLKFDFRIYVLVTSVDPLRIYVFKDGLARFATAKYVEPTKNNVANIYMHLTNYAINKVHNHYSVDDEAGSKRRISTVIRWLERSHCDVKRLWADIDDVIIKTLISAHSTLRQNYRSCFLNHDQITACFDILGFDILLDQKLKPYLLEVNHSPSFHTDTDLDRDIKETLLYDTLCLVNFNAVDRRQCIEEEKRKIMTRLTTVRKAAEPNLNRDSSDKLQEKFNDEQLQYEEAHLGNFRRVYPLEGTDRYSKFFSTSSSLYQETATFKAHTQHARLQREGILRRKEELDVLQKKKKDPAVRPESPDVKRPRAKRKIPEIATADKVPVPVAMPVVTPKTHYPEKIIPKEEMDRVNDLIEREFLINRMGILQFVRDMFNQRLEDTSTAVEALAATSDAPEKLKLKNLVNEMSPTSFKVAVSRAANTARIDVSDTADGGRALDLPVESEPALTCIPALPPRLSAPPPPPLHPPLHPPLRPPRCSSDVGTVVTSVCNLSMPSQSVAESKDGASSSQTLPCALCISAARTGNAGGTRNLKPLPGATDHPRQGMSRSLNPIVRHSPPDLGGSAGRMRHYERMLAQLPNQRELSMMLNLCRDPTGNHSNLWNWPEVRLSMRPDVRLSMTKSQTASSVSADESGFDEKLRLNRLVPTHQLKKQPKVAPKLVDDTLNSNKWLEISKLDIHKQFRSE